VAVALYRGAAVRRAAVDRYLLPAAAAGPDLRDGKLGSCPGPPQLGGLHKNSKRIIT